MTLKQNKKTIELFDYILDKYLGLINNSNNSRIQLLVDILLVKRDIFIEKAYLYINRL